MSMSVGSSDGDDEPMMDINTTPLIDVMLVLLIYLIISLPPATHAVKLDMPQGKSSPPPTQPVVIDLEVDFDGTYIWNGNTVPDFATLENYFKSASRQVPQPELHIKPNKRVKYDYVALALASAQRNEITRIGFVGNEQYYE
jgi:biopolymer transport protein ExbD